MSGWGYIAVETGIPGLAGILLTGLLAVATAVALIVFLLRGDLGRASGLSGPRIVLLGSALGTGVFAVSIKLAIIFALSHMNLGVPLARNEVVYAPSADALRSYGPAKPYQWAALPSSLAAGEPAPAAAKLGRRLFFDKGLSRDGSTSCADCHDLNDASGADGKATSTGVGGAVGTRNAPTVINVAFQRRLFWDGRAKSLEEQARGPLIHPAEMAMPSHAAVVEVLWRQDSYRDEFSKVFGPNSLTIENVVAAISAFERTLIAANTPYDRFIRGDVSALSPQQQNGLALFHSVGCTACHAGPNFSVASVFAKEAGLRLFPANRTALRAALESHRHLPASLGRAVPTAFRVPSLRNVARTAPYFHDGTVKTLEQAVTVMAAAQLGLAVEAEGTGNDLQQTEMKRSLSIREKGDIVAFLESLSGDVDAAVETPAAATGRSAGGH